MLSINNSALISPIGEELIDLSVPEDSIDELKDYASQLPSIQISPNFVSNLEMLASGALSPLDRFMGRADFENVLGEMRLANGCMFPVPITLPVAAKTDLHLGKDVAIRNSEFELMAIMTVEEIYEWDRNLFAEKVFGTQDHNHPLISEIQNWGPLNISGKLQVLNLPRHYDFQDLWLTPGQIRAELNRLSAKDVLAILPNTGLIPDIEVINSKIIENFDGIVLLQLAVGKPKLGDYEYYTRVRTYQYMAETHLDKGRYLISLLPLALQAAGEREALWHLVIQRNFGANFSLVDGTERNYLNSNGRGSKLKKPINVMEPLHELGNKIFPSQFHVGRYEHNRSNGGLKTTLSDAPGVLDKSHSPNNSSDSTWYTFQKAVIEKLSEDQIPQDNRGVCIWFTGLSGSGKSTTTGILTWSLLEHGREVSVLDGDVVRTNLSKGLGFSKADRDTNVRRIGFVASEIVRFGGVVICAVVSPYKAARNDVRHMVGDDQFVEVFVDTPLEVCEERDVKGFYAKARRAEIRGFTGIDDPYEPPEHPEITLDTINNSPRDNAERIIGYLAEQGFIQPKKSV